MVNSTPRMRKQMEVLRAKLAMGDEERLRLSPTCVFPGSGGITKPLRAGERGARQVRPAEQAYRRDAVSPTETLRWDVQNSVVSQTGTRGGYFTTPTAETAIFCVKSLAKTKRRSFPL